MKTVFITTGATVTFQKLIEISLNDKFINCLQNEGYERMILQYGSQQDGVTLFNNGLKSLSATVSTEIDSIIGTLSNGFIIEGFPFTNDIKTVMSKADLIISHAGTGSILDSLRLAKPLIVVINSQLMNNHQAEISDELARHNYLLGCDADLNELMKKIKLVESIKPTTLPEPNTTIIDEIIQQL